MIENTTCASDYGWFWTKLDQYLSTQDLKQTRQRKIIIDYLLQLNSHVDAEGLFSRIRKDHPNIGLATIYRTLNLLKAAGLVEEQSFADGRAIFEIDHPGTHHDHLVCTNCGKVVEFTNEDIERLQREIAAENGFELTNHRMDLYGQCLQGCVKT